MGSFVECAPGQIVGSVVDNVVLCLEPAGYFASQPLTAYLLIISIFVALAALYFNQLVSKKRATIDIVMHDSVSKEVNDAKADISELKSCTIYEISNTFESDMEKRKSILLLLNHYEFMAVGANNGAFDKGLLQQMKHSSIVSTYKRLKPCIERVRETEGRDTLFQDFEVLATAFDNKRLKKKGS